MDLLDFMSFFSFVESNNIGRPLGPQSLLRSPATYFLGGKPLNFKVLTRAIRYSSLGVHSVGPVRDFLDFCIKGVFCWNSILPQTSPTGRSPAEVSATLRLIQSYAIAQPQATHPKSSSQRTLHVFFWEKFGECCFEHMILCHPKVPEWKKHIDMLVIIFRFSPHLWEKEGEQKPSTILLVHFGHFFTQIKDTRMSQEVDGSIF